MISLLTGPANQTENVSALSLLVFHQANNAAVYFKMLHFQRNAIGRDHLRIVGTIIRLTQNDSLEVGRKLIYLTSRYFEYSIDSDSDGC